MTPLVSSASKICKSPYAMVYGLQSCNYQGVIDGLMDSSRFIHIFDYHLGYKGHDQAFEVTPPISQIDVSKTGTADACKAALVNIVIENLKRSKAGKPLIPVLFAIDCENNSRPLTAENLTTKKEKENKKVTYKEIRRAYKLCVECSDPEIRAIARETFKFVKVNDDLSLELIPAPWSDKNWKELWDQRMQTPKKPARKKPSWKKQLSAIKDDSVQKMGKSFRSSSSSSMESSYEKAYSSSSSSTLSCHTTSISSPSLSTLDSLSFTHSLTSPSSTTSSLSLDSPSSTTSSLSLDSPSSTTSSLSLDSSSSTTSTLSLESPTSKDSLTFPSSTTTTVSLTSPASTTSPTSMDSSSPMHLRHYQRRTLNERLTTLEKLFIHAL